MFSLRCDRTPKVVDQVRLWLFIPETVPPDQHGPSRRSRHLASPVDLERSRIPKANMIWLIPLNKAMKPTQNKMRYTRRAREYTRSDPDTQNANKMSRIPEMSPTHQ